MVHLPAGRRHPGLGMTALLPLEGQEGLLLVLWGRGWGTGQEQEAFDRHLFIHHINKINKLLYVF